MKLEAPVNANYSATVVRVRNKVTLEGLDNLVALPMLGYQALVSKDTEEGTLGVLFTAESQLSEEFAKVNNLHRHAELNADQTQTGYLEPTRRVKAIKLRRHQSNALFMPLASLAYTGVKVDDLNEGDTFDKLNGHEVVRKYLVKQPGVARVDKNAVPKFRRVDTTFLPLHTDTDNYWRNQHVIPANAPVVVTQKIHGTSIRLANTIVKRKLTWKDRLAKRFGVNVAETEYDHVYGSRRVIKDANDPDQAHFYGSDLWSEYGKRYDHLIPENFVVFGELIGWTLEGAPIQKGYTYDVQSGAELYVYRVAVITAGALLVDLDWDQVKHFAEDRGMKTVPELWRGRHDEFVAEEWIDRRFADEWDGAIPLSDQKTVDEGVCVRTDIGRAPYILKAKSPIFLNHESKLLDQDVVDIETQGSEEYEEVSDGE